MVRMPDDKSAGVRAQKGPYQVPGQWSDGRNLDQLAVDELSLVDAGDRFYLAFGQVQVPLAASSIKDGTVAEIRPMVKLVISKAAMKKMLTVLNAAATNNNSK